MKPLSQTLLAATLLISVPLTARAQQTAEAKVPVRTPLISLTLSHAGPLTLAAATPARPALREVLPGYGHPSVAMKQYGYRRLDWELGRAWLGTLIGFTYAYIGDLIIHYETDFSKGYYLLDEKNNGDNVYNVLLYCGIPPYFAMRGIRSVSIMRKNSLGSYLSGLVGSVLGLIYWTNTGEKRSIAGFAAFTGLTTLCAHIGYSIF